MKAARDLGLSAIALIGLSSTSVFATTWDLVGVVESCDAFACGQIGLEVGVPIVGFVTADDPASGPNSTFGAADITDYEAIIQDFSVGPADSTIDSATLTTDAGGEFSAGEVVLSGSVDGGIFGPIDLTLTVDVSNDTWMVETDFLGIGVVATGSGAWSLEPDDDDLGAIRDNCTEVFNVDQRDTDLDGFGNRCDADFDQSCLTNFGDLTIMSEVFFTPGDLVTDLDGDGQTNFADLVIMAEQFFAPPGPSGLTNNCPP